MQIQKLEIFLQTLENYFVSIACRNYGDSGERDTFYGDFIVKVIWRLSGNSIYHTFSIKLTGIFFFTRTVAILIIQAEEQ